MIEAINKTKTRIDLRRVRSAAQAALESRRLGSAEVSIAFITSRAMARLNRTYRGRAGTTDVLSFAGEGKFLGEVLIDYSKVKKQAKAAGKSAGDELIFIMIHGLLHLLGHNDETDRQRAEMIRRGEELIKKLRL